MKQVIVVRKDIQMRKGKLAAQVAHASVESVVVMGIANVKEWLNEGMTKIVVGCDSEDELFQLYNKARENGVSAFIIQDAGRTEFKEPTYTCVAIGPDEDNNVDHITGDLKLL